MIIVPDAKIIKIEFCNSYGSDEEQLNRLLKLQADEPFFWLNEIHPVNDRGHEYYWMLYQGKFPKEDSWRNKEK